MSVVRIKNISSSDYTFGSNTIPSGNSIVITKNEYFSTVSSSGFDAEKLELSIDLTDGFVASVSDFGAVGDGATDDTIAFQKAIDYSIENCIGSLEIPAGVFLISDTLNVHGTIRISGAGRSSSYLKLLKNNLTLLSVSNENTVDVTNLAMIGDNDFSNPSLSAITIFQSSNASVINCNFSGFYNTVNILGSTSVLRLVGNNFEHYNNYLLGSNYVGTLLLSANNTDSSTTEVTQEYVTSSIKQSSDEILSTVSSTYATNLIVKQLVIANSQTVGSTQTSTYTVSVPGLTGSHVCVLVPTISQQGMTYGGCCSSPDILTATVSNSTAATQSTGNVNLIAIKMT